MKLPKGFSNKKKEDLDELEEMYEEELEKEIIKDLRELDDTYIY